VLFVSMLEEELVDIPHLSINFNVMVTTRQEFDQCCRFGGVKNLKFVVFDGKYKLGCRSLVLVGTLS
jgi:hypothetical protein